MTLKDMLGRSGVVSREDALRVLNEHFVMPDLAVEEMSISSALGRVLASVIASPADLPEFNRSTMDGYAVRSADTFGAAESRPALLNLVGDILMGTVPERGIGKGEAMKIATGGALPSGADAVVMFEQTQPVDASSIEVVKAVGPGENMVRAGDDIKRGEVVLSPGHRMRPQDMSALASLGITRIEVFARPRVAIISTGNEIVPADTVPSPGRIRDSNSYNLEGLITQAGGVPVRKGIIPDDYARLRANVDRDSFARRPAMIAHAATSTNPSMRRARPACSKAGTAEPVPKELGFGWDPARIRRNHPLFPLRCRTSLAFPAVHRTANRYNRR